MKNKYYWKKRIDETAQRRFDITYDQMEKETRKIYTKITKEIMTEVEGLYYKLLDEDLTRTEIWTYKHYKDLSNSINAKLVELGLEEIDILNYNLEEALREIYTETPLPQITPVKASFSVLNDIQVQQIIARPWSKKHFTSTVWDNKDKLIKILKKGITDSIVLGKSKDKLVATVMEKMQVGFNAADRVVRTELMHTINAGQIQRYKDAGYTELEIIITHDERLCSKCMEHDGDIVDIDSTNVPPFHARCRCTISPVLK